MGRIVVLGGGESAVGAAVLAKVKEFDVFLSDLSPIKPEYKQLIETYQIPYEENQHTESVILNADEIIKSPGIPDNVPILISARSKGIPVISEIEFAGRFTNAKMICITGSNGKTTTTMLTYHILSKAGFNVGLAGNVGKSFALQVATQDFEYYVLELSSFQLDGMINFKADVAILMNITPDHLNRYDNNFQNYIHSKFRILQNQTESDSFIYWENDPVILEEIKKRNISAEIYPFSIDRSEKTRAFIDNNKLIINTLNTSFAMPEQELSLKGTHNTYNSMAAGLAASLMHVRKDIIRESLSDFEGVEHRLEYVATVKNVRFINDSKATNVNSCWYALQSMKTPVVLILGGTDKGNDYSEIEELIKSKVHTLVFLAKDNQRLHDFFDGKVDKIVDVHSMKEAVSVSYELSNEGDTVLLSPCCASFDYFINYEDRGRQFKRCVRDL